MWDGEIDLKGGLILDKNFIDYYNHVEIRKSQQYSCRCKVCDKAVGDKTIVYLKTFRLSAQPFHICIPCWQKINEMVEEEIHKK